MPGAGAHLLVPIGGTGQEEVCQDHAWGQAVHPHRLSGSLNLPIQAAHEMSNACAHTASETQVLQGFLTSKHA